MEFYFDEQKYQTMIKQKNEEIQGFQTELDHMLRTLQTIHNVNALKGVIYFQNIE